MTERGASVDHAMFIGLGLDHLATSGDLRQLSRESPTNLQAVARTDRIARLGQQLLELGVLALHLTQPFDVGPCRRTWYATSKRWHR